jgi:hypothetical protein
MNFPRVVPAKADSRSSYPAHAGYPVRRGLSDQSLASLEYWIARSSRAMTEFDADRLLTCEIARTYALTGSGNTAAILVFSVAALKGLTM